jgi:hypothetical protein
LNEGGSVHDANGIASTDENNVLGRLISHSARSEGGIENRRQRDGVIDGNSSGGDLRNGRAIKEKEVATRIGNNNFRNRGG